MGKHLHHDEFYFFARKFDIQSAPIGLSLTLTKSFLRFILLITTVFIPLTTVSCGDLSCLLFYIGCMTNEDTRYRIKIKGQLDPRWQDWFDGLTITPTDSGNTLLSGVIVDQAALHGVFKKIRNLGLTIVSVKPLRKGDESISPFSNAQ